MAVDYFEACIQLCIEDCAEAGGDCDPIDCIEECTELEGDD